MTAPSISEVQLAQLLGPYLAKLENLGIKFNLVLRQFSGFLPEFTAMQNSIAVGVARYGGRLIPRSLVERNHSDLTVAFRSIVEDGAGVIIVSLNVSKISCWRRVQRPTARLEGYSSRHDHHHLMEFHRTALDYGHATTPYDQSLHSHSRYAIPRWLLLSQ